MGLTAGKHGAELGGFAATQDIGLRDVVGLAPWGDTAVATYDYANSCIF